MYIHLYTIQTRAVRAQFYYLLLKTGYFSVTLVPDFALPTVNLV